MVNWFGCFTEVEVFWLLWGALVALCWGSFLNVVAFRLVFETPFFRKRSHCPHCDKQLGWYELLPIISWFFLRGRCGSCKATISWLYPLIEFLTMVSFLGLWCVVPGPFFPAYALFFSALLITIRTDIEALLIFRYFTVALIPIGWFCAWMGYLPISLFMSVVATGSGYALLAAVRGIFFWATGRVGMGQGDLELLAMIGAFTGVIGVWVALFSASIVGSVIGLILMVMRRADKQTPIPFGAFLSLGALFAVFLSCYHSLDFLFFII